VGPVTIILTDVDGQASLAAGAVAAVLLVGWPAGVLFAERAARRRRAPYARHARRRPRRPLVSWGLR